MPFKMLIYQKRDHLGIININESINDQTKLIRLSDELAEICSEIISDEEVRVVALTGAEEKSFSMEIDLISTVLGTDEEDKTKSWSIAEPIAKLDRPVIAAINGDVIGFGLELALVCDIRIAVEISHFGLPHIKAGLIPWDGGTQRLARLVGRGKALEMILTGETIDAQEAYRIGLIHRVVPPKELMEVAMNMAREMASKGPIALRYAKEAIYKGMDMTLEQGLRLEADLYLLIHTTRDRIGGIEAFREKRSPKFEGK